MVLSFIGELIGGILFDLYARYWAIIHYLFIVRRTLKDWWMNLVMDFIIPILIIWFLLVFITENKGYDYTQKDAIEEAVVDVEQSNNKIRYFLKGKKYR